MKSPKSMFAESERISNECLICVHISTFQNHISAFQPGISVMVVTRGNLTSREGEEKTIKPAIESTPADHTKEIII